MEFKRYKVLFVCTGNICRSPLAQGIFEQMVDESGLGLQFLVDSAGTDSYHVGQEVDPRMQATAVKNGYSFSHASRAVRPQDLEQFDVLFAMDHSHFRRLRAMARNDEQRNKIRMFREFDPEGDEHQEVPDPYYGGPEGFEHVFRIVYRTSQSIIEAFQNSDLP